MSTYVVIVPEGSEVVWAENSAIDRPLMIDKAQLADLTRPDEGKPLVQSFDSVVRASVWGLPLRPARKVDIKDITSC